MLLGALLALAKAQAQCLQLLLVEGIIQTVEHILRSALQALLIRDFAALKHIAKYFYLRPQVVVAKPHHEIAYALRPLLVVQNPKHRPLLPSRKDAAVGELPKHVIIGQVGKLRHLLCQLVCHLVELLHREAAPAVVQSEQVTV